jgi:enoyl-CoA hydratase
MSKVSVTTPAEGVRLVTLTDPERRNAMDAVMGAELIASTAALRDDPDARVVVVTGEGKAFCAGADLPALFGDAERPVTQTHDELQQYYRAFFSVLELPLPTIAAVNGPAVGAGLNLAMACDIRIAGPRAAFGATFSKIGLHPGGGCTWFLVRALGQSRALQTMLLGDPLDAEKAVAWGLAEGVEDDPVAALRERRPDSGPQHQAQRGDRGRDGRPAGGARVRVLGSGSVGVLAAAAGVGREVPLGGRVSRAHCGADGRCHGQ